MYGEVTVMTKDGAVLLIVSEQDGSEGGCSLEMTMSQAWALGIKLLNAARAVNRDN